METRITYAIIIILTSLGISCSNDDDQEFSLENPKSVTRCNKEIDPESAVSWCMNGTELAAPNETITFVAELYSAEDNPANASFNWTIESGHMEILDTAKTIDGEVARSVATILFKDNFIGNGVIVVEANNDTGGGFARHVVEIDPN